MVQWMVDTRRSVKARRSSRKAMGTCVSGLRLLPTPIKIVTEGEAGFSGSVGKGGGLWLVRQQDAKDGHGRHEERLGRTVGEAELLKPHEVRIGFVAEQRVTGGQQ